MSHGGGDGGGERWLVSYSDFITLLMVLFVVLYSMGQVDVVKYKLLAENLRSAFSGGGPVKVVDSQISTGGGTVKDGAPNPIVVPGIPEKPPLPKKLPVTYPVCWQHPISGLKSVFRRVSTVF
jgi:chemotaxis protein MotB